jgi:hypothetical protein
MRSAAARLLALEIVALSAFGAGCNLDECDYGEVVCAGNTLRHCISNDTSLHWQDTECGRMCVRTELEDGMPVGFCSLELTPNPACNGESRARCTDDGRLVACTAGYVTSVSATCGTRALCLDSPVATCLLSPNPDPRCAPVVSEFERNVCDGHHVLECAAGYLTGDHDCGQDVSCLPAPPGMPSLGAICGAS